MDAIKYSKMIDVGHFYGGLSGKSKDDFEDGNAKFITYMNVFSNPSLKVNVDDKVRIEEGEKQNTVEYGDVIFTGSSETPDECGMSSVLEEHTDEPLYLNSFCFGYRFNDVQVIVPAFFKHLFRSNSIRAKIAKTANGVTRFNVSKKLFGEIEIPIPSIMIQEKIANQLDAFSSVIVNLETELASRQKQYEHYRNELLTFDKSKCVEWRTLGEVCKFQNGFAFKSNLFQKEGSPIIRITNIGDGTVSIADIKYFHPEDYKENLSLYEIHKDDILVAMSGATTGKIGKVNFEETAYLNQRVGKFVPDTNVLSNSFLYYLLLERTGFMYQLAGGGAQPNLSSTKLQKELLVPIPTMSVQNEIVYVLDNFEALMSNIKQELEARKKQYEYYREQLLTFE